MWLYIYIYIYIYAPSKKLASVHFLKHTSSGYNMGPVNDPLHWAKNEKADSHKMAFT